MKKRVLSLVLAFVLSFSMMPMSAFAEETGTVTEQKAQNGEDTVDVSSTGEDISGGNAVTKGAAVEAAQALINALPEEVTAKNADELQAQLMAIDEALTALNDEQRAELNMTRLENICAALNGLVAVQAGEHANHPVCGDANCKDHGETLTGWTAIADGTALLNTTLAGYYYLTDDVALDVTWTPANGTVLDLNGHSITVNAAVEAITVPADSSFTLTDCNSSNGVHYFKDDTTKKRWVPCEENASGSFSVEGGVITHSVNYNARGVTVQGTGTFIMYGGTICGHGSSNEDGAGVFVGNKGEFGMYGGAIKGNTTYNFGGGVYVYGGTFTMTGGMISDNKAYSGSGVYMENNAIFNLSGTASIRDNTATLAGGGAYLTGGTFNMTGGTISDNTATGGGGGVYVISGTFNMTGGAITGNTVRGTANRYGGGVYLDRDDSSAAFNMSGTPVIINNKDADGMANNVYLWGNSTDSIGNPIHITGELEDGAQIGVTPDTLPVGFSAEIAKFPMDMDRSCINKFTADPHGFKIAGTLVPGENCNYVTIQAGAHEHHLCGGDECTQIGDHSCAKTVFKAWASTTSLPSTAGNWYLTGNVTLPSTYSWEPKGNTVLCLNGYTVKGAGKEMIKVTEGTTFTLCDDSGKGKISGDEVFYNGRIGVLVNGGTFNLYDGSVTDTNGSDSSGVRMKDGIFNMYGGSVANNRTIGVDVVGGTFTMYDGLITGNAKNSFSSNAVEVGGIFLMKGGSITKNYGGVYVIGGTFEMSGNSEISNNTLDLAHVTIVSSAGVCLDGIRANPVFKMSDNARIINNKVTGVQNRANSAGGLLVAAEAKVSISGNAQITGNEWDGKINNVLLWKWRYLNVDSKLAPTARIGVDTLYEPDEMPSTDDGVEIVASGADDDTLDYTQIFTPDATGNNYEVIRKGSKLYLKVHQHSWNYTANGTTITAACACGEQGGSVTIEAPAADTLTYDGNAKTAAIVNNILPADVTAPTITYKVKGSNASAAPVNAGTYIASITLTGADGNPATASVEYTIKAKELTNLKIDVADAGNYDGSEKKPAVTVKDGDTLIPGDEYEIIYSNNKNAGTANVTIRSKAGGNYTFSDTMAQFTIAKAKGGTLQEHGFSQKFSDRSERSLRPEYDLPAGHTWTYRMSDADVTGSAKVASAAINATTGEITYKLADGAAGDTVSWMVTISNDNYEDFTQKLILTLTAKDDQKELRVTGDNTVAYGKTLTLGTTGGSGTGEVTFRIDKANSTGEATMDANGVLTARKVGSVIIIATKAGDADYNEAVSASFEITITKATPTGEPKYTVITTDGKTLVDAGLTLKDSTLNPAEGTLKWVDEVGNELQGDTRVEVNKTYRWSFTPSNDNYGTLTGEIVLYPVDAPAISAQPGDATVKPGEKAVFEVTATGTDLTYQWKIDRNDGKGFVDINGANGASYTTGVTDMDCNGFKYQCVISNAVGSVTTAAVTLTVTDNIAPTPTPDPYRIIEGANGSWTQSTDGSGSLLIRGNGEFSKFLNVKVDGNIIDPTNYEAREGSTIIELKAEYLKTLSEGTHTFEIAWTDGTAKTSFTVAKNTSGNDDTGNNDNDDNNKDSNNDSGNNNSGSNNTAISGDNTAQTLTGSPNTGDASGLWIALFLASAAGLAVMLVRRKK